MSALIGEDEQSTAMQVAVQEVDHSRELLLAEVLGDLSPAQQQAHIDTVAEARAAIIDHWRKASHQFLMIGRSLNRLAEILPEASLTRMLASYDRVKDNGAGEAVLPFGRTTAIRLMTVARAVDTGRFTEAFQAAGRTFSEDLLPPYTIAYKLLTFEPPLLIEAVRKDLVRPDISRGTIEAFHEAVKRPPEKVDIARLLKDMSRTDKALSRHYGEITRLHEHKATVMRQLEAAGVKVPLTAGVGAVTDIAVDLLKRQITEMDGTIDAAADDEVQAA